MSNFKDDGERKFLHDIANPLTTAIFLMDVILSSMATKPENLNEKLEKVHAALQKSQNLLQARREVLQNISKAEAG